MEKGFRKLFCLLLAILTVFQLTSTGLVNAAQIQEYHAESAAEEPMPIAQGENEDEGEAYLTLGIQVGEDVKTDSYGPVELTAYSRYKIVAKFHPEDRGREQDVTKKVKLSIESNGADAYLEGMLFHTYQPGKTIAISASYIIDGKTYTDVCTVKVIDLEVSEAAKYAVASNLVYTEFYPQDYGKTIHSILSDGSVLYKGEEYILQEELGATMSSLYSAAVGSWVLVNQEIKQVVFSYQNMECSVTVVCTLLHNKQSNEKIISYACKNLTQSAGIKPIEYPGEWLYKGKLMFQAGAIYFDSHISANDKDNVTVVGHSLGGGVAAYVSTQKQVRGHCFNAPNTFLFAVEDMEVSSAEGGNNYKNVFHGLDKRLTRYYRNGLDKKFMDMRGKGESPLITVKDRSSLNGLHSELGWYYHGIKQMIHYDINANRVYIPVASTQSNNKEGFGGHDWYPAGLIESSRDYTFGSSQNDSLVLTSLGWSEIYGGPGNDGVNIVPGLSKEELADILAELVTLPAGSLLKFQKVLVLSYKAYEYMQKAKDIASLADNLLKPDKVYPGPGNDTIVAIHLTPQHYFYSAGDGYDIINDSSGNDEIHIFGYYNLDLVPGEIDGDPVYYIYGENNGYKEKIMLVMAGGRGSYRIYQDGNFRGEIKRSKASEGDSKKIRSSKISCPVDVQIFDAEGELVHTLKDGEVSENTFPFGYAAVTLENGEYVKTITLFDDSYSFKVTGNGTGTMEYTYSVLDADGNITYRTIRDVPVQQGAVYTPSEDLEVSILHGDLDGDGTNDYTAQYIKPTALSLSQTAASLPFTQALTLRASVLPENAEQTVVWSSSDPSVAVVDENGVVTAVGAGTAKIIATSLCETGISAACTVTVPDTAISVENLSVTGIRSSYSYTGEPIQPMPTVTYNGVTLEYGRDYLLDYENALQPGTAVMTLSGTGLFSGERTFSYEIGQITVSYVVKKAAEDCLASGADTQYEKALWLHDWLTLRANYDYTYSEYGPNGVLLKKTGVCQSYAEAYQLLLEEVGITCKVVSAPEMDHAWNLVKLGGEWCHVDCTWDDPGAGGMENHAYFGLNDAMMSRDHIWDKSKYPAATSMENLYLVREGKPVVSDEEEFRVYLETMAEAETPEFEIYYIGDQGDFSILDQFVAWFGENNWKYGLSSYSIGGTAYAMTVEMTYSEPWSKPSPLDKPVAGEEFDLQGPDGRYKSENYTNNGVVIIFGQTSCSNTRSLLQKLKANGNLDTLREAGVELLVNLLDCDDLTMDETLVKDYPDVRFTYSDSALLWRNLENVGYSGSSVSLPVAFVYNKEGMITYYSTGYISNLNVLMGEAYAVSTGAEIPPPADWLDSSFIPVKGIEFSLPGVGADHSFQNYKEDGLIVIFGRTSCGNTQWLLERLALFTDELNQAGVEVLVNLDDYTSETALAGSGYPEKYPDMIFTYDKNGMDTTFGQMLNCVDSNGWVTLPCVFVVNDNCMITYFSEGNVSNVHALLEAAYTTCDYVPLEILKQPESVIVKPGETASVMVEASGKDLIYQWYVKDPGSAKFIKSTVTDAVYSYVMSEEKSGRQVYCVIRDAFGRSAKTDTVELVMGIPVQITKQPESAQAAIGEQVSTSVEATGEGLQYQWYVKNPGSSDFSQSSFTGAEYFYKMTAETSGRQVYCVVTDTYGNRVQTETVELCASVTILTQPADAQVAVDQMASATVTAFGKELKYQWYVKTPDSTAFSKTSETGDTYSCKMTQDSSGTEAYCVITDAFGNQVQTEPVTLTMVVIPLVIRKQPVNAQASLDSLVSVMVEAEGSGLQYQWYVKEPGAADFIPSAVVTADYSYQMTVETSGRQVYCVITDACGKTVQTDTVELCAAVSILTQPENATAPVNQKVTTTVTAFGKDLTYTWYVKNPGSSKFTKSSVTGDTYFYTMTTEKSGRQVYCVITDAFGNKVQTETVTLTKVDTRVTILKQPASDQVPLGSQISAKVEAKGIGLTYQWYMKEPGASKYAKTSVTEDTYSFEMTTETSGRRVYCVVTNAYGKQVQTKTVRLSAAASILSQPEDASAADGKKVSTTVRAFGTDLTYKWYVKNPGSSKITKSSVTGATYSFTMTADKSGREVYCIVTDAYGNRVQTETVILTLKETPLTIITQPVNTQAKLEKTVSVTVQADGDGLKYQWFVKDPGAEDFTKSSVTRATYSFKMTKAKSGRLVYCVITDIRGNQVQTDTVELCAAASIVRQPKNASAFRGKVVSTKVTAFGTGLTYTWYVKAPGSSKYTVSSITGNTYSDTMTKAMSGSRVYCVITDVYGNKAKTATVKLTMRS